jgi:uncharacterized protein (DUF58 family)
MEFADYRAYQPGDDLRLVDWNVYARLRTVLVRLFHEDRDLRVGVLVDASASMAFAGKADHAATLGAALALAGLQRQDSVTLGVSGAPLRVSGRNRSGLAGMLRVLESQEPSGAGDLVRDLRGWERLDRLYLITDLLVPDAEQQRTLRALATVARAPVLLHVLGREELDPDLRRPCELTDSERGDTLLVQGGGGAARRYQRALTTWLDALQARCRGLRVTYVPAFATVPVQTLLSERFPRAGVLA